MSTKPDLENRLSELARIDAIESATFPLRIADALRLMDDYASPLRIPTGGPSGGDNEPTTDDRSRADRQELIRLVLQREQMARGITRILNDWAPLTTTTTTTGETENAPIWCENCAKHGKAEPRRGDGSKLCRWCGDVKRAYGKLPNEALQLLRTRHPRISDNDYRRLLGVGTKTAGKKRA